jgi:hypothetical protein
MIKLMLMIICNYYKKNNKRNFKDILASNDQNLMINSLYKSSNLDESNGSKIVSIVSILTILSLFKDLDNLLIIVKSSYCILMIFAH